MNFPFLSAITLVPLVGALALFLVPPDRQGWLKGLALTASTVPLILALLVWHGFDAHDPTMQFSERIAWLPSLGMDYVLGVDGVSLPMVLLTALITPLALLASFGIRDRLRSYLSLFLLLQTGMFGVFTALNFVHFFLYWELGLVPMFLLIKLWGSANRHYAAFKFFIYTLVGSLSMLATFQALYLVTGTFDFLALAEQAQDGSLGGPLARLAARGGLALAPSTCALLAYVGIGLAFAIKIPIWPFHTWLPDAHTEAPTAASMVLAAVLLKMGVYGFLRILLPIFPDVSHRLAPALGGLALAGILLGALAALSQLDLKRMIAYSSVNHMGYCLLGIAAALRRGDLNDQAMALNGTLLQMVNHGISTGALFFLVGVLYDRTHTRDLREYGGLRREMPVTAGIMGIAAFSSMGLPGLNSFVSEFLIFRGAFPLVTPLTLLALLGVIVTVVYLLRLLQQVFFGSPRVSAHALPDMTPRELATVAPLIALMFAIGLAPGPLLGITNAAVLTLLEGL